MTQQQQQTNLTAHCPAADKFSLPHFAKQVVIDTKDVDDANFSAFIPQYENKRQQFRAGTELPLDLIKNDSVSREIIDGSSELSSNAFHLMQNISKADTRVQPLFGSVDRSVAISNSPISKIVPPIISKSFSYPQDLCTRFEKRESNNYSLVNEQENNLSQVIKSEEPVSGLNTKALHHQNFPMEINRNGDSKIELSSLLKTIVVGSTTNNDTNKNNITPTRDGYPTNKISADLLLQNMPRSAGTLAADLRNPLTNYNSGDVVPLADIRRNHNHGYDRQDYPIKEESQDTEMISAVDSSVNLIKSDAHDNSKPSKYKFATQEEIEAALGKLR